MPDAPALQVVIFRDGNLIGSEVFLPGEYALGSSSTCELVLSDAAVSPCQAFLSFREGKVTLQNVAAGVNMTVNGEPKKIADVRALDDISIGPFLLKFRVMGPKQSGLSGPAPAPDAAHVPAAAFASDMARPPRSAAPAPASVAAAHPVVASIARPDTVSLQATAIAVPTAPPAPKPAAPPRANGAAVAMPVPARVPPRPAPAPVAARSAFAVPAPPAAPVCVPIDAGKPSPHLAAALAAIRKEEVAARAAVAAAPEGKDVAGPCLRVRVFWGKTTVGLYGFPFGSQVTAGPAETHDVPLYRIDLPGEQFLLATCDKAGKTGWNVRVPKGQRAFRFEPSGWKPVDGTSDGDAIKVPLEQGKLLRMGDAAYSVELRVENVRQAPRALVNELVASGAIFPLVLALLLSVGTVLGVMFLPKPSKESPDFTPQQMLTAAKAILKPPDKKPERPKKEKKVVEEKKVEKTATKKADVPPDMPKAATANVKTAMAAVKKVTSSVAVESLLKATKNIAGGPKGYGDLGTGLKISPLIGKPPMAMMGTGFGPGMGGFGTQTRGLGGIRGMGGGGDGGIGAFGGSGTGKGKVGSVVISAPASGFQHRGGGGSLPRELIAKVINDHLGEVRGCYERALLREAGLAGKLVLEWTIDVNGRVEEIKVKQVTLKGSEVSNCIVGSLKTWVFPKPTGGKVIVSYPFLFNSVGF